MFDKIANLHIDIYEGTTDEYLGSNNFTATLEVEKVFLDLINYHIVPKTIILTDVN